MSSKRGTSSAKGTMPSNRRPPPPPIGGANPAKGKAVDKLKDGIARYESIPRRTRLISSSLFFLFCLGGLYWTDYLESKFPPTEKQQRQIEELKNVRFPSKADFDEAREQATRAQAKPGKETRT